MHPKRLRLTSFFLMCCLVISGCAPVSQNTALFASIQVSPCPVPTVSVPPKVTANLNEAFFLPTPPIFPYPSLPSERQILDDYAQCVSDQLERYIDAWMRGQAPAEIPNELLPWGVNLKDYKNFTLKRPHEITAEQQWGIRPAAKIDENGLLGGFPDPNATYLLNPAFLAPFGSRMIIAGEFPHARFFNIQVTPPFDLNTYRLDGGIGVGEVPIVDVDIEPLPGHTNPYRVGADRNATKRGFRVIYEMAKGDPVGLNPAFRQPDFRAKGNVRHGSGIIYQGPWGHPKSDGPGRGLVDTGSIWVRYYAPDHDKGSLGGVALPKITFQLKDGREFYIHADISTYMDRTQTEVSRTGSRYSAPHHVQHGPDYGWFKQAGIFEALMGGIAIGTGFADKDYINALVQGVAGRGDDMPPSGNYEQSATSATYIDYLVRSIGLEEDHVVVMTGRLPSFPETRSGAATMTAAEVRYWSLTGFEVPQGLDLLPAMFGTAPAGIAVNSVMDDEVVLDESRDFVIVFSRDEERPRNATKEAGVTWVDWGPSAEVSWTFRWMSVAPEWKADFAPSVDQLGSRGDFWSKYYDPDAVSRNSHTGFLGKYQPKIHYMTRAEFESLGPRVRPSDVPDWR